MPQPPATLPDAATAPRDPRHEILAQVIAPWLGHASTTKRDALAHHSPIIARWHTTASPAQHQTLKRLNAHAWTTQNHLDKAMANLKTPRDFAAERLQQALNTRYALDVDVASTYLQLYIPLKIATFTVSPGAARTWTVSMLDAALHNFEPSEAQPQAYEQNSGFISQPSSTGHFESLPAIAAKISVAQFATLCRELDIGGHYQRYLNDYLGMTNPVAQASLRHTLKQSQRAALDLALEMALIRADIPQAGYDGIKQLIGDPRGATHGCPALTGYNLSMMSSRLTGIVVFAEDLDTRRGEVPVIAYIPDDPHHPLKHYDNTSALMRALSHKLRAPDYQRFFSRFVDHEEQGQVFASLNHRLTEVTWHPHTPGEPLPSWRETAVERPNLEFRSEKITRDLFEYLYQVKLSKVLNDARSQAVSTADVNQKARWERWGFIQKIASAVLQAIAFIATPFVPPLGALMLGYSAYQLLDETFEGIVDWAEGLTREAFGHAMGFVEQLIQLGLFATGVPIAETLMRQVLPAELLQFIDRFNPVTLPNGQRRLWDPDLAPYRHELTLAKDSRPNERGLHHHHAKLVLHLNGEHYSVLWNHADERYYLQHPTRANAYRPPAMTNGQGAWVIELERPLSWDSATLMRRLGYQADTLSDAQLQQVRDVSGTHDNTLRKMHVTQQTPPPLLADSLKRFQVDQGIQDFISQMNSDDPALYRQADPQIQLQLLTSYGLWPEGKTLRFLDASGNTTWEFGQHRGASVVQIHEAQLNSGDLLRTVIESLDEAERKTLLEEEFGQPPRSAQTRAAALRKKLARIAQDKRFTLFDSHYRSANRAHSARQQKLIDSAPHPGLPTSVAQELLDHASAQELRAIDQGQVPKRLADLAAWTQQEVRTTRAYEGLYLDAVDNPDTARLALHSLDNLPGWSPQVRIEVRHYRSDGPLLDSIGAEQAQIKRRLILTAEGDYVPEDNGRLFGDTDFYTAILQAIPDAQRNALGIHIGQGPVLRQAIARHPLDRPALRRLLDTDPLLKPAYDPEVMRLRGGMEGYRAADAPTPGPSQGPSLERIAHELFPAQTPEQIQHLLHLFAARPAGALATLRAMKDEFFRMDIVLAMWEVNTPRIHPETGIALSPEALGYARHSRNLWVRELRSAWRHEGAVDHYHEPPTINGRILRLNAPVFGELPRINAHMAHISWLEISGEHARLELNGFLQVFPRLRQLAVRDIALEHLPSQILSMPQLNELILSHCAITLSYESRAGISAMSRLVTLDLSNNPLTLFPSVANMPNLRYLDLANTGLSELPEGLLGRANLELVMLAHNQIRELPPAFFNLPAAASERFDLSNNPLSRATLEQVKTYFQRTGNSMAIDADALDTERVARLYPTFTHTDVNHFIYSLPGDLASGTAAIDQLERDYAAIGLDMEPWTQDPHASLQERTYRHLFMQDLQAGWRQETPLDEHTAQDTPHHELVLTKPVSAALPALRTPFKHVTALTLQGRGSALQLGRFLQHFPALRRLSIENYWLGELPTGIEQLPQLNHLSLSRCGLRLPAAQADVIAGMRNLQRLDLSHNPLERIPDISQLPQLSRLSLSHTGLGEVPEALLSAQTSGVWKDLSHNAIHDLPDALFHAGSGLNAGLNLSGNPLSRQTLQRIKNHSQATGELFLVDAPAAEFQRLRLLYPELPDSEVSHIYFQLPGDLDAAGPEITRLGSEFEQMRTDLQQWVIDIPLRDPWLDTVLDEGARAEEQIRRRLFKELLEECWRRETEPDDENITTQLTYKLVFHGQLLGDMPRLDARFKHVTLIEIIGEGTNGRIDGLLACFPNLRQLTVERHRLTDIPEGVFDLQHLQDLALPDSQIRLSAHSAQQLASLTDIEYLDLSDNPLGLSPDLSHLSRLTTVFMHNCGLSEVPAGVFGLSRLKVLDLSDNQIQHLPSDILEMPLPLNDDSDLSGNPLTAESMELLRRYYQLTGYELGVEEAMEDEFGVPLLPPRSPQPMEE
ncbi:Leucine Rich Repeat [Pseudomonas sp. ok272]|uniref:leucine-rich repeat domain-containing protein n=1 Tax=unclassified Pseudomonas TaxID=196821 RepID=UPI0008D11E73|nr:MULTISPECIES: leucine-rich repeat domain-containing protein [unclassified Pseudomonas]SEM38138.1 Leucine Rich Repeat [Pseudomonas sp. ok272]SFM38678.1 Leucine Rich Repeat [Pseudomonas sp. ok602]